MPPVYRFGLFRLDTGVGSLTRDEHPTGLGPRAVGLLQVLVERSNQYVSKSELLDAAWPGMVVEEAIQRQVGDRRFDGKVLSNLGRPSACIGRTRRGDPVS
ncbi:MAG TPA: hypothetical protein VH041_15350 [Caldimonas sp.]|nr:hypothetical protein [Caldimonas sp.]HEX4235668.1 hypothetical protein [Caldimonas sp.]